MLWAAGRGLQSRSSIWVAGEGGGSRRWPGMAMAVGAMSARVGPACRDCRGGHNACVKPEGSEVSVSVVVVHRQGEQAQLRRAKARQATSTRQSSRHTVYCTEMIEHFSFVSMSNPTRLPPHPRVQRQGFYPCVCLAAP